MSAQGQVRDGVQREAQRAAQRRINYQARDLSWLSFNGRVLQEAADASLPLADRLTFLSIFSSNLDEFYRVRVGSLTQVAGRRKSQEEQPSRGVTRVTLKAIERRVLDLQEQFDRTYQEIVAAMEEAGVHIVNERGLTPQQSEFAHRFFAEQVEGELAVLMLDEATDLGPALGDNNLHLAVRMNTPDQTRVRHALVSIPPRVPRFIQLPQRVEEGRVREDVIFLDDLLRHCMDDIFDIFPHYGNFRAFTLKTTRNAEFRLGTDFGAGYVEQLRRGLRERNRGDFVRVIHDRAMPKSLLNAITSKMPMAPQAHIIPGDRYHNFRDFSSFPKLAPLVRGSNEQPATPAPHPKLRDSASLFQVLDQGEVLLQCPYQPFRHLIDLLREAALDPEVTSISMTAYRLAEDSQIVSALHNALHNGKKVRVYAELTARFDEQANIEHATRLAQAGAEIIEPLRNYKVHAKLCLIRRRQGQGFRRYAAVSSGNFNERTANLYTDSILLSSCPDLTRDVAALFKFLQDPSRLPKYRRMLVAPRHLRRGLRKLIRNEIRAAQEGAQAWIRIKVNNLIDEKIIRQLEKAAAAGVRIDIVCRTTFGINPDLPELRGNIRAVSIVDRLLEHCRLFGVANRGEPLYYMGSADLMPRNLDRRVEALIRIDDPQMRADYDRMFQMQMNDNDKARLLDGRQSNKRPAPWAPTDRTRNAQSELRAYYRGQAQAAAGG